jgi:hypothetical protein
MHIGKNVTETLWKILDGRRDKDQIVKICSDIEESNHAMKNVIRSNNNGDQIDTSALTWLLSEQQSNAIKEIIKKIRFPTGFAANINDLISKKSEFGAGMKTHDWHIFIKVIHIILYSLYICILHVVFIAFFYKILTRSFYKYCSTFYLYLSHTTSPTVSNKLYMILENI